MIDTMDPIILNHGWTKVDWHVQTRRRRVKTESGDHN